MTDKDLLDKPLADMTPNERVAAFAALDALTAQIRKENESFVPTYCPKAPMVISDYVPTGAIKSMADGKMYDSKSKYYKSVKEAGMVVLGNDAPRESKKKIDSDLTHRDVKNAIERLKSR